jgi:hypothetical protein
MIPFRLLGPAALAIALPAAAGEAPPAPAAKPELVEVVRIWDQAAHAAFTDLVRHREAWFCTFRESDRHVHGKDGTIRVLHSADGRRWESAALIAEKGVDLRDPKLSVTPDGRLMLLMGGSVYEKRKLVTRQPRVAFSKDGRTWTSPQVILAPGEWLWRVTWHQGRAYGVSYNAGGKDWAITLFAGEDGVRYERITAFDIPGRPNETTLRFLPDDGMIAFVRREAGNAKAWIGSSRPPYTAWTWHETAHRVGGPNFIVLPDGRMWAGGRSYPGGSRTVLGRFGRKTYEPVLTLPSGGDTSYPGLVWHEGLLWMSYYASHEGKTSIYLATIRLPRQEESR